MKKKIMTVDEVAAYFGLHKDTIYDLVKENKLPHIRLGGRIFFLEDVLENG
ncbi:helix-turn-helix domain-containing protein [Oceanobacillus sp. FSL H7-0719]|uniref:helix-turn-helix domain-containing protein n=1 Tax=Oceanobacillus sp. FSL H7-0719 TaxID=2954507 RepID=UPI003256585A